MQPNTKISVITKEDVSATGGNTIVQGRMSEEDEFSKYYDGGIYSTGVSIIIPPYDFNTLELKVLENNTLLQCITAYEVNVDGTGHSINLNPDMVEAEAPIEEQAKLEDIKALFSTPYLDMDMIAIRRFIRRDLETTGNAYLEVLRDLNGVLVFLVPVEAKSIRYVRYDQAVPVNIMVLRGGKELSITIKRRERRFAQVIGGKLTYFKEYGASRDLDSVTGTWSAKGSVSLATRATELIAFKIGKDAATPYGVPRWVNQTPSVVGSRLAEESNLDYLNSGGIPPIIIFVSGGAAGEETTKSLENLFRNKDVNNGNRAAVVELQSTSGDINSSSRVDVKVERFGSEKVRDSMFETYDTRCEVRVRSSFRLPPIFVGRTQDYSHATATASYEVAEAQVFRPERLLMDGVMNSIIRKEFGVYNYFFTSLPLSVKDTKEQLQALQMVSTLGGITHNTLLKAVNEVTNLQLVAEESRGDTLIQAKEKEPAPVQGVEVAPAIDPDLPLKNKRDVDISTLVAWWNNWASKGDEPIIGVEGLMVAVANLTGTDRQVFEDRLTMLMYGDSHEAYYELCGCCVATDLTLYRGRYEN